MSKIIIKKFLREITLILKGPRGESSNNNVIYNIHLTLRQTINIIVMNYLIQC